MFFSLPLLAEVDRHFIEALYKPSSVKDFRLSPSGDNAITIYSEDGIDYIDVYDLNARTGSNIQVAGSEKVKFRTLRWIDNDSVIVYWNDARKDRSTVFHLNYEENEISIAKRFDFSQSGAVINHLPEEDNTIIFAKYSTDIGFQDFYKLQLLDENSEKNYFNKKNKLNINIKNVTDWAFDSKKELRFVESKQNEEFVYYYREPDSNTWLETARRPESDLNVFFALDDNNRLISLVKKNENRRVVAYLDPATMKQSEIAYEDPLYDISAPLLGKNNELIGVALIKQGAAEQVYFDSTKNRIKELVQQKKQHENVYIIASNLENTRFILLGSKNGHHYKYYDYNLLSDSLKFTKDPRPWLKKIEFSKAHTLNITKPDGAVIEAYLSMPAKVVGKVPLIVNPHGGPFGVRDYKYENETEILTHHGFAVLRVNFRGSSGFGTDYIDSAKQGLGTIIEEDIYQSLKYVLSRFSIDENKVCSYGISYGGYSTAMLLAKHPDVFKCGVSFAGVFDLNLQINEAKRFSQYRDGLDEYFKNYIADIESEPELQKQKSPVFHAARLKAPLLLIHGTDDSIVDIEQSYRMHHALEMNGIKSELHIFDEFVHGFRNTEDRVLFFEKIIPFFEKNLKTIE